MSHSKRFGISFNAPAVLIFAAVCLAARVLATLTGGESNRLVFSVYSSSLSDPLTYVRCVCHVFGHADWGHLFGNMMTFLILGPMIEEKYGTSNTVFVMAATAILTGIVNMIIFPHTALLGASGIVFAFIMLASITTVKEGGKIPVTFIIVALLYIGQQVYQGVFQKDNISQLTHILGGIIGSVFGFMMQKSRKNS